MKNALKILVIQFLTICLSIFIVDCGLLSFVFSDNHLSSSRTCSDMSTHFEHTHSIGFEYEVFTNDLSEKLNKANSVLQIISLTEHPIINNYSSFVWQPPKLS